MASKATANAGLAPMRTRWLAAAAVGSFALLVGSAHGSAGAGLRSGLEAAFEVADAMFPGDASPDIVDLHDGRSPVPARWAASFARFAQEDRASLPAAGGVVFVGSSSIDLWTDLQARFPTQHVVRRGLAGATIADCTRNLDRLVLPYRPRVVVFYAGDNDLAAGVAPERVVADYTEWVAQVHRALPAAKIVFVSIKPSPSRAALMPLIRKTNALVATYARTDARLDFVDIFDAMLDRDAHARRELFRADGLHMTAAGYNVWHDAIARHIDR